MRAFLAGAIGLAAAFTSGIIASVDCGKAPAAPGDWTEIVGGLVPTEFVGALAPEPDDAVSYAMACRNALGIPAGTVIPPMNCLAGTEVPIAPQVQQGDGTWVDRPLTTGNEAADLQFYEDLRRSQEGLPPRPGAPTIRCNQQWLQSDHQTAPNGGPIYRCWNYAHVQRIQVTPTVQVVLMCRQQHFSNPWSSKQRIDQYNANPTDANFRLAFEFDDVGLIWTNTESGRTCWFNQLSGIPGVHVPSPDQGPTTPDAVSRAFADVGVRRLPSLPAHYFNFSGAGAWYPPSRTGGCAGCHTNRAFVTSPWVAGADVVPGSNNAPYSSVQYGNWFRAWRHVSISTGPVTPRLGGAATAQKCVECHRIGAMGTGPYSFGPVFNQAIHGGPSSYMPFDQTVTTQQQWNDLYSHHVSALRCCAANPTALGCLVQDLGAGPPLPAPVAGTQAPSCTSPPYRNF